jgi:hypothetical protein
MARQRRADAKRASAARLAGRRAKIVPGGGTSNQKGGPVDGRTRPPDKLYGSLGAALLHRLQAALLAAVGWRIGSTSFTCRKAMTWDQARVAALYIGVALSLLIKLKRHFLGGVA